MADLTDVVVEGKRLTLFELLEMLEDKHDEIPITGLDVTMLPPKNATDDVTDEDSGAEEDPCIENVPKSQLHAEVAVTLLPESPETNIIDPPVVSVPQTSSGPSKNVRKSRKRSPSPKEVSRRKLPRKKKVVREHAWTKTELPRNEKLFPPMQSCQPPHKSPLEYFRMFMNDDVLGLMLKYTNLYASQHNLPGNITENEMLSFIGVLLLSGYNKMSRKVMYWQNEDDTHNKMVAGAISRDRFQYIMSNLHVCDNNELDKKDRFAKIRPLLEKLNTKFLDLCPYQEFHSVDESMVPYFGGHGCKQFIRGKPIRFGFKFWCGGPSTGYLSWLEPYQGANTCSPKYADHGLGYSVIMSYADILPENIPFKLFFDNFFTSFDLLCDLKLRGLLASGTVRSNRIDKSCTLDKNAMKNAKRGHWECATDEYTGISIIQWNDNNIVSVASNFDRVHPLTNVNRFSKELKKKVVIPQPKAINTYNKKMGGIDRADQNISLYRVHIRGKKWYFPLITHLIDVCENNAWQLHEIHEKTMDHLNFRRCIARSILKSNQRVVQRSGRHSLKYETETRFDRKDHLICSLPVLPSGKKQQLVCRFCNKKSTTTCAKCNVTLHVDCFIPYHTRC